MDSAIRSFITTYQELNPNRIDILEEVPNALEFFKYVAINRPFVVYGAVKTWAAVQKWNCTYLQEKLNGHTVKVAVTRKGNADSPTKADDGDGFYFVKPLELEEPFGEFLKYIQHQEQCSATGNVKYAQSQNDNLHGEYLTLFDDVEPDFPWAHTALGQGPEAINLWIGNSCSTTALHKDNYENIYCQMIGSKHFVLLPPAETICANEMMLPQATYSETGKDARLRVTLDTDAEPIPCAIWDPDKPLENRNCYSSLSKPIRVDLHPGDMLYLPALWYHKVRQTCGVEGICCAVNYWYDMEFAGLLYPASNFLRDIGLMEA